ncbi:hypothetical protein F0562_004384 [Nyssa sinensis]|uniref:non-specific serine/threonine protein kinase n=1 Tax=Nyssa sinensis TaxID=561372 RepID=A0A5J5BXY1_9ASTE|nr:hypothetical protein F0562_004384 [Nyssa sinensis]
MSSSLRVSVGLLHSSRLSHHQGFSGFYTTSIPRVSMRSSLQKKLKKFSFDLPRLCSVNGDDNAFACGMSDAQNNSVDHEGEGSMEKNENRQGKLLTFNEILKRLRRYGISGILSYGLLNTAYYLTTFLLVWFYVAPAPGKMGYFAAVERFVKLMAMVWAGSQVTKLIRAGGALALAPFVDRGLSWFTVKFKFESQGKAFMAIKTFCSRRFHGARFLLLLYSDKKMDGSTGQGSNSVDMFLRNYKLGKTLGIGSFGKVKIAEHALTGHKVAIKILNRRKIKNMEMEEKVRREIKILRLFMHPHIIRLYEVIETPSDIYVVMEYVKAGELFDYIVEKGRLQEDEARNFFQQIISGVEYCHRNMVVHRDLKPENLLLDSKFLTMPAPEVISGKLYAGPEVDVWSCGVILYALLCGTLPFDDENIPNLFKKIKGGIYTLPSHLSPGARDLIPRMLVVDPMKRMTIPEIRMHPWFQAHLPRYLAVPPPDTMQQAKKIDEEILQEVISMGFDRNNLVDYLRNRVQNEATVAYYLLLDNRFRVSSGYLGAEFQESVESDYNRMNSIDVSASAVGQRLPGYMDHQGMGSRPQFPVERKWTLGLQSRAPPREIMTEVLKALQELNVGWKKIGHYNIKCRWIPGIPGHHEGMINNPMHSNHYFGDESTIIENDGVANLPNVVKFEVQLYKTREDKYLLDLQRVQGPQFLFLDLCAAFLAQLRELEKLRLHHLTPTIKLLL